MPQYGSAISGEELGHLMLAFVAHLDVVPTKEGAHVRGQFDEVQAQCRVGRVHRRLSQVIQAGQHLHEWSQGRLGGVPQFVEQEPVRRSQHRLLRPAERIASTRSRGDGVVAVHDLVEAGAESPGADGDHLHPWLVPPGDPIPALEQHRPQESLQPVAEQIGDSITVGEECQHEGYPKVRHGQIAHEHLALLSGQRVPKGGERIGVKDVVLRGTIPPALVTQ
mmetsp:Transcript_6400/g.18784  ORF Transcript_6400/g.18784 Transcript_6400/m.18784 type:complete len:222 (+) Transcript_6400:3508-4173(+)